MSRQWRVLVSRKRFGFGYQEFEDLKRGSMAIFCALCAQPGINLPADWREYKNRCAHQASISGRCQCISLAKTFSCEVL